MASAQKEGAVLVSAENHHGMHHSEIVLFNRDTDGSGVFYNTLGVVDDVSDEEFGAHFRALDPEQLKRDFDGDVVFLNGRAADQSLAGIAANDPAESTCLLNFQDDHGAGLGPEHRYTLHFPPGGQPPVDAFRSLTAYPAEDLKLIANPINRYSVGDHASPLRMDRDGGLRLHPQPGTPPDELDPNWLPTPPDRGWFVILRLCRPRRQPSTGPEDARVSTWRTDPQAAERGRYGPDVGGPTHDRGGLPQAGRW